MRTRFSIFACLLAVSLAGVAPAEESAVRPIYLILDSSGSMWGRLPDESPKIVAAKQALREFLASDDGALEVALRVYGHRQEGDCRDSELVIPFTPASALSERLDELLAGIKPLGKTPITYSLRQALADFGDRSGDLVLITDGIETCDEDPCEFVREQVGLIDVRIHVVGFGLADQDREAMRCIAEAADTEYHDATSAASLAAELALIRGDELDLGFYLKAEDGEGNALPARGVLRRKDGPSFEVKTHARNEAAPGKYELTAGVQTRNGTLYRPVKKTVEVSKRADTTVTVRLAVPPTVRVAFRSGGETQRGSLVHVFEDGKELFAFRPTDEPYIDEGTYEFRARPNPEHQLAVTETFEAGDHKTVVFDTSWMVQVKVKMVAAGSGIWFRQNYELWQDGEPKYRVHVHNGVRVPPGTYDLRLPDKLSPWTRSGLVVTDEKEQTFEVTVPVGHATVVYQRADGSRDADKRCFVGPGTDGDGFFKNSGKRLPLLPGTYNVVGWRGDYERVVFEVVEGEDTEVVLRALP